jgi:hypothetical protein
MRVVTGNGEGDVVDVEMLYRMLDRVSTAQRNVQAETVLFCWIVDRSWCWHVQPTALADVGNCIELRNYTWTDLLLPTT